MLQHLFVYGTLAPGRSNAHVLEGIAGTWQEASVQGFLMQQGWGAELGYPGLVLDSDGDNIEGFLFSSEQLDSHWQMIDDFEGSEYQRVSTTIKTKQQLEINAYVYVVK